MYSEENGIALVVKRMINSLMFKLIGIGLVLFYALPLSISEHLAFPIAHAVAAGATVGLLIFYLWSVFNQVRQTVFFGVMFTVLYQFLFVILQSEEYALLIGSMGLFTLLGVIMFLTRKIDWYAIGKTDSAVTPTLENGNTRYTSDCQANESTRVFRSHHNRSHRHVPPAMQQSCP
jgi:inner membrane protein